MHVVLFGASAPMHDHHRGEGSFDRALAELREGTSRWVTTPVTRSTFRSLDAMPALLVREGVAQWRLLPVRPTRDPDPVAPRLAMAAPHMLRAMTLAEKAGITTWIEGVPLCLLGPFADRAIGAPREFGAVCAGCEARPACPGLDPLYRSRFEGDELRARKRVESRAGAPAFPPFSR